MTIVEFFDRTPIENMISCLTVQPDKIVFIGEKKPMKRQEEIYNEFLAEKGLTVEFEFKPINKNSISKIAEVLTEIIETEPDCAFDLTGGDDLVLVAMGIVFERYKNEKNIQMHRFNVRTGTCTDCDNDGILPRTMVPNLSVKENIMLYGGSVMEFDGEKGMAEWEFDDEFISDVEVMWEVCRRDPGLWNTQIATLANVFASSGETDSLYFCAFKSYIENLLEKKSSYVWDAALLGDLETYGFISDYFDDGEMVSFTYKNEQIKRLLSKAGTILELKVFLSAKKIVDSNGEPRYNDVQTGVYIDWDAELHNKCEDVKDTQNEVDVILMKGLVPIFISCKNGAVGEDELYKLNTVAERFGGIYAKKVLVSTYLGKASQDSREYFEQRAKDMQIQLIENVHKLTDEEFLREIKSKVC